MNTSTLSSRGRYGHETVEERRGVLHSPSQWASPGWENQRPRTLQENETIQIHTAMSTVSEGDGFDVTTFMNNQTILPF